MSGAVVSLCLTACFYSCIRAASYNSLTCGVPQGSIVRHILLLTYSLCSFGFLALQVEIVVCFSIFPPARLKLSLFLLRLRCYFPIAVSLCSKNAHYDLIALTSPLPRYLDIGFQTNLGLCSRYFSSSIRV